MKRNGFNTVDILIAVLMGVYGLIIFYPFYNAIVVSFTTEFAYTRTPFMLYPKEFTLQSYEFVFRNAALWNSMFVTVFVLVVGALYNMFMTTTIAYALTKDIWGMKFISLAIIFTMYFQGGLIPFYMLVIRIGLYDSLLSMVLPVGIQIMYMLVIRNYFAEIPKELSESAKIDGANDFVIFYRIMLPVAIPILVTFVLYYSVERWNEWWHALLFIRSPKKMPLQSVLRQIIMDASSLTHNSSVPDDMMNTYTEGLKMAVIVVAMAPVMVLYPFLQRYFIRGLMSGAVKM